MQRVLKICAAAAITSTLAASYAAGAAVDDLDAPTSGKAFGASAVGHRLDVEMTVHNWVLCASQPFAERLVRARQEGRAAAMKALADLETARSCGRLAEMQVILQDPLLDALVGAGDHARVYSALINISGSWASGFVVYDGVPAE